MSRKQEQVPYRIHEMGNVAAIPLKILAFKNQRPIGFAKIGKVQQGKPKVAGIPLAEIGGSGKLYTKRKELDNGHWSYSCSDRFF
jgi:hypothetical protein